MVLMKEVTRYGRDERVNSKEYFYFDTSKNESDPRISPSQSVTVSVTITPPNSRERETPYPSVTTMHHLASNMQ
ncbi:hypothetical protein Lal_00027013 [Lupinus albus]|nr:hypothetical protein Lal_00027013 [Lupinus albus]